MGEYLRILEPVAAMPEVKNEVFAPRVSSLQGKTVLLLDNLKPGALQLLTKVGALLKSECGIRDVITVSKVPTYSRVSTLEELGNNVGKAHLAVTALGD